jgi:hypothetical protein
VPEDTDYAVAGNSVPHPLGASFATAPPLEHTLTTQQHILLTGSYVHRWVVGWTDCAAARHSNTPTPAPRLPLPPAPRTYEPLSRTYHSCQGMCPGGGPVQLLATSKHPRSPLQPCHSPSSQTHISYSTDQFLMMRPRPRDNYKPHYSAVSTLSPSFPLLPCHSVAPLPFRPPHPPPPRGPGTQSPTRQHK